jgi:transcriptional regulator with XRE-family HTH domain
MPTANVREKRLQRGWTLDDLAAKCAAEGVPTSVPNLHRIERTQQVPRPGLRAVLAKLLDLDVNDFERAS